MRIPADDERKSLVCGKNGMNASHQIRIEGIFCAFYPLSSRVRQGSKKLEAGRTNVKNLVHEVAAKFDAGGEVGFGRREHRT